MIPAIFGLAGTALSPDEASFFRAAKPAGFILFARNVASPQQLRRLTDSLRDCLGRARLPILIDQEGGRVQRLNPPHWRNAPPMGLFGNVYRINPALAVRGANANAALLGADLAAAGITVDCLPVLDVPVKGADAVIGDRAFSDDPAIVAKLGAAAATGLALAGVLPVIKHIPGHGRARVDSHKALPVVDAPLAELRRTDFVPFARLKDAPFAMTAHVAYSALDPENPATFSRRVVAEVVRGDIGFTGLLLSDDVGMEALTGAIRERAERAIAAGVDIVLHCSGVRKEMEDVVAGLATLPLENETALEGVLEKAEKGAAVDVPRWAAVWAAAEGEIKNLVA